MLSGDLKRDAELYKQRATEAVAHAAAVRDALVPGSLMVMGEAATYCALNAMRWEEAVGDLLVDPGAHGRPAQEPRILGLHAADQLRPGRSGVDGVP